MSGFNIGRRMTKLTPGGSGNSAYDAPKNHGSDTTVTLSASDWNRVHVFEAGSAVAIAMPSATPAGSRMILVKKGAGNLVFTRDGTDLFVNDKTTLRNETASETWGAVCEIFVDVVGHISIGATSGHWFTQ